MVGGRRLGKAIARAATPAPPEVRHLMAAPREQPPHPALFVVLAQPRSGSTYLCDLLDGHPAAVCHGELFHGRCIFYARGFALRPGLEPQRAAALRRSSPLGFLEAVVAASLADGIRRVGFKLFPEHEPIVLDWLARHRTIPVLRLRRRSWLAQYSSFRIAQLDGTWFNVPGGQRTRRVRFSLRGYLDYAERLAAEERLIHALLRGRPCLELDYETLGRPEVQQRILGFLQLPPAPLSSRYVKQDRRDTLRRFSNPLKAACLGPPLRFAPLRRLARWMQRLRPRR